MTIDIHLPDLSFVRKIEEAFHINRGVYNTIDAWFFDNGFINIAERRKQVLMFLQHITVNLSEEKTRNRQLFPNGLTRALENHRTEIERTAVLA